MRLLFLSCLLGLLLAVGVPFVEAQTPTALIPATGQVGSCDFRTGKVGFECIPQYIGYLIRFFLSFAAGFFMFGIMIAGYKYMFGSITTQGTEAGKKEIIARCVGLAVIVFSYLLVDTILRALT